jgi:leucyl-tRNA synthetase
MDFKLIELKWQKYWAENPEINRAGSVDDKKEKKYILVEFPYPSGSGLHVGHAFSFTGADVYARFKRMQGFNVMFPMGWDAFGLPTENYAIKMKRKPQEITKENTDHFREQMKRLAYSFDWSREVNTTDPNYYKWTQWIFIQLFKKGLAYKKEMPINWCPSCKIGLANEEVVDSKCERCGVEVSRRNISQWVVKITDYADKLIEGLEKTDFIEKVKQQQINWIGKSEGAKVKFLISNDQFLNKTEKKYLEVFTTRPDTLFGATFMVIAPEHELVSNLISNDQFLISNEIKEEIKNYVKDARKKSDMERTELSKDKTGVFSGLYVINPVNNKQIPIWISDFVLASYGTGAIMSVPAHDERDFAFAKKFGLEINYVIKPNIGKYLIIEKSLSKENFDKLNEYGDINIEGTSKGWGKLVRVSVDNKKESKFLEFLSKNLLKESEDGGSWYADSTGTTNMVVLNNKIFDLNNSGELNNFKEYGRSVGIPEEQLDVELKYNSEVDDGEMINSESINGMVPSMAFEKMIKWLEKKGIGEKTASYHLRDWIFSRQHYWGEPIPMIKCSKCGWVPVPDKDLPIVLPEVEAYEPTDDGKSPLSKIESFVKCKCPVCGGESERETDTMPNWAGSDWYYLAYCFASKLKDKIGSSDIFSSSQKELKYWSPVDVYIGGDEHNVLHLLYSRFIYKFLWDEGFLPKDIPEPYYKRMSHGVILGPDNQRMSKSKGNVIVPETVADKYGVDVIRMYLMFMGPFDSTMAWNENTLMGVKRFLDRFNKFIRSQRDVNHASSKEVKLIINKLIDAVTRDLEGFKYNTAIAKLMEALNKISNDQFLISNEDLKKIIKLIAPFAPYTAEELFNEFNEGSIHQSNWPEVDKKYLVEGEVNIPVAINGKVRSQIVVDRSQMLDKEKILDMAKSDDKVKKWVGNGKIVKEIYVPGKMVNLVVR